MRAASLVAQMVKNLPTMQETEIDPQIRKILEKVSTHSSEFRGLRSLVGYSPRGHSQTQLSD